MVRNLEDRGVAFSIWLRKGYQWEIGKPRPLKISFHRSSQRRKKNFEPGFHRRSRGSISLSSSLLQRGPLYAKPASKSPFESNILRILRNEIEYQCDYAPPQQMDLVSSGSQ
ncbi:hypothetical protein L6164_024367 [Bauhinia variegata]|uniref:Uncharacterized protein n=1 Tax=Bauhinia variegata TaxID=167791 RepID=A0ACB9LXL5_BAUVA|nr:hypothetical protein L6164_024367 [Bauhinia variegata]